MSSPVSKYQQITQLSELPPSSPLISTPPVLTAIVPASPGYFLSDRPIERELYRMFDLGLMSLSTCPAPQEMQSAHFNAHAAKRLNEKLSPSSSETLASFLLRMQRVHSMKMSEIQIVNDFEGIDSQWVVELYQEATQYHPQAYQIPSKLFLAQLSKPAVKLSLHVLFKYENPALSPRKKDVAQLHRAFVSHIDPIDKGLVKASFAVHPQKNGSEVEEGCHVHILKPSTEGGQIREVSVGNHFPHSAFGSAIIVSIDPASIELDDAGQVIEEKLRVVVRCENIYRALFEHAFGILQLSSTSSYESNTPAEYLTQQMHGKIAFQSNLSSIIGVHQLHDARYWFHFEKSIGEDLRSRLFKDLPSDPVVSTALALMQELMVRDLHLNWIANDFLAPAHEISRNLWKFLQDPRMPKHPLAELRLKKLLPVEFLALPWILGGLFSLALRSQTSHEDASPSAALVDHEQKPAIQLRLLEQKDIYALFFIDLDKISSLLRMSLSFNLLGDRQEDVTEILLEECFKFIPEDGFSDVSLLEKNKFWLKKEDSEEVYKRSRNQDMVETVNELLDSANPFFQFCGATLQLMLWEACPQPAPTNVLINKTLRRLLISESPKLQHAGWLMTKKVLKNPHLQKPETPLKTLNEACFYLLNAMKNSPDQPYIQSLLQQRQTFSIWSSVMILRALEELQSFMSFLDLYQWMSKYAPGQVFNLIFNHKLTEKRSNFVALAAKTLMQRADQIAVTSSLSTCYTTLYEAMIRMASKKKISPKTYLTEAELTHLIENRKTESKAETALRQKLLRILNPEAPKAVKARKREMILADFIKGKEEKKAASGPKKKVHTAARFIQHMVIALKLTDPTIVEGQEWSLLTELFNQVDDEKLVLPTSLLNDLISNLLPRVPKELPLRYLASYVLLKQLIGRSHKKQYREHYVQMMLTLLDAQTFNVHNASVIAQSLTLIPAIEIQTNLKLRQTLEKQLPHFFELLKEDSPSLAGLLTGISLLPVLDKDTAPLLFKIGLPLLKTLGADEVSPVVQALSRLQGKFDTGSCRQLAMPIMQALPHTEYPLAFAWLKYIHEKVNRGDLLIIWPKFGKHLAVDRLLTSAEVLPLIKMATKILKKFDQYADLPNFITKKQLEILVVEGCRTNVPRENIEELINLAIENELRSDILLKAKIHIIQKDIKAGLYLEKNVDALIEIATTSANAFLNDLHELLYLPVINDLLKMAKKDWDTTALSLHPEYFDLAFKLLELVKMSNKTSFVVGWKATIGLLNSMRECIPECYLPKISSLKGLCQESKETLFDMRVSLCIRMLQKDNIAYGIRELPALFIQAKALDNYRIDDIEGIVRDLLDEILIDDLNEVSIANFKALLPPEYRTKVGNNSFAGLVAHLSLDHYEAASGTVPPQVLQLIAAPFITSSNIKKTSQLPRIRMLFPIFLQDSYNVRHLTCIWKHLLDKFNFMDLRALAFTQKAFEEVSWNKLDVKKCLMLLFAEGNPNISILPKLLQDASFKEAVASQMHLNDILKLRAPWAQLIPIVIGDKSISNDHIKYLLTHRQDYKLPNDTVWRIIQQARTRVEFRSSLVRFLSELLLSAPLEFQQEILTAVEQWSLLSLDEITFLQGKSPLTLDACLKAENNVSPHRFHSFLERNISTITEKEWECVLGHVSSAMHPVDLTSKVLDIWNKTELANTSTLVLVKKPETVTLVGNELKAALKCEKWGNFDWGIQYPDHFMEILSKQKVLAFSEISSLLKGLILNALEEEKYNDVNTFLQAPIKNFLSLVDRGCLSSHFLSKAQEHKKAGQGKPAVTYLFLCIALSLPTLNKRTWDRSEIDPKIAAELISSFSTWNQWVYNNTSDVYVYFLSRLIFEALVHMKRNEPSVLKTLAPAPENLVVLFKAVVALIDKYDSLSKAGAPAKNDLCVALCNLLQIAVLRKQHKAVLETCALIPSTLDNLIKEDYGISGIRDVENARKKVIRYNPNKVPENLKEEIFYYLPEGFENTRIVDCLFWADLDPKEELNIDHTTYWQGLFIPYARYVFGDELNTLETFDAAKNPPKMLETRLKEFLKNPDTIQQIMTSLNAEPHLKAQIQRLPSFKMPEGRWTADAVVKALKAQAFTAYVAPFNRWLDFNTPEAYVQLALGCLEIYYTFDDLAEFKKWANILQSKSSGSFIRILYTVSTELLKKNKKNAGELRAFLKKSIG